MSNINLSDKVSIMNYGIGVQHRLANLSELVADIVKEKDYSDIKKLTDNLLELMSMDERKTPVYADALIDAIRENLLQARVDLLKECKLYEELRNTNEVYITQLSEAVTEGELFLNNVKDNRETHSDALAFAQLKSRVKELKTSKTVASTLTEQLALYQKNSAAFAERISSVINALMPLWESKIALSVNKESTEKAFKMMKALMNEVKAV
ncbi:MAG: toxic anion resistance protein [Lachnospiraceae bacterium]|nr:toxic anion resistance protein [Lachnospiraceae bacterium]